MDLTAFVRALSPNRPLDHLDARYVERPESGGDQLARLAALDVEPITVFGPSGVGKSTEVMRAASQLMHDATPIIVPLDRVLDLTQLTLDDVFAACARAVASGSPARLALSLTGRLVAAAAGVSLPGPDSAPPLDALLEALRARANRDGRRVILLLDGLEKADEDAARSILKGLVRLAPDAGVVVVVPPSLVIGPASYRTMEDYRQFAITPLQEGASPFLHAVLERRLDGVAPPTVDTSMIDRAAEVSGGVPRTFLSVLKSAGVYAALADRPRIEPYDLDDAIDEHREALARVLAGGDIELLARIANGSGLDVLPTHARARFISHGLLVASDPMSTGLGAVHPLLHSMVEQGQLDQLWRSARST